MKSMMKIIEEIEIDRDWRFNELEFYKKVPKFYTNKLFQTKVKSYWQMCVPAIYAHWEGFVVSALKLVVDYLNSQSLSYTSVIQEIIIFSNKDRFKYLSGNCNRTQRMRFLNEFFNEQSKGISIDSSLITASSNLNFKQFSNMLEELGIVLTPNHLEQKSKLEKLVTYRNKIAHGENNILVSEADINEMVYCIMILIDETIVCIEKYLLNKDYLIKI